MRANATNVNNGNIEHTNVLCFSDGLITQACIIL